ncbi:MAG: 4Fe-4S dicluster domain-containing protein [Nitrospiraceae bacterium]|nr:4Fe-4S dicluster domain-containing protein [Nitrospiraceae bacterium]
MPTIVVDSERCTGCGRCVTTCPEQILVQREQGAPPSPGRLEQCISCGHCVAVCREGAINHSGCLKERVHPIDSSLLPSEAQVLEMMRLRRSVRVFDDRPVDRATVEKLIEAAALAPSAHNRRRTSYVVVDDGAVRKEMLTLTVGCYKKILKQLANPLVRTVLRPLLGSAVREAMGMVPNFQDLVAALERGEDRVFYNAPCIVVAHAPDDMYFPEANAQLAIHNATFAAQSMGLGSVQYGYLVSACEREKGLLRLLSIPKGNKVYAAMGVGYPRSPFENWIDRPGPQVEWI